MGLQKRVWQAVVKCVRCWCWSPAHQCFVFPLGHGKLPRSLSLKAHVASADRNVLRNVTLLLLG